jgi:hypothetical protein
MYAILLEQVTKRPPIHLRRSLVKQRAKARFESVSHQPEKFASGLSHFRIERVFHESLFGRVSPICVRARGSATR